MIKRPAAAAIENIHLGFEVGTGDPVAIPLRNLAILGQTQESGKTTALEALASRPSARVLVFRTKRGEGSFGQAHTVKPYFRDRADWKFVMGLIETMMQEKNRFLRQYVIPITKNTRTLADVRKAVKAKTAKGKGGIYVEIEAYLDEVVDVLEYSEGMFADKLDLRPGLNVMDMREYQTSVQMLIVQSAIDWVNERETNTVVVVPEAWEFIPQGRGSPVKLAAESLVRKGSGIGNHIWIDSQDMAGVDKTTVRGCPVVLVGVQRELNELKRNAASLPAPASKIKPADIMALKRGEFFVTFGNTLTKVYVQPAWMGPDEAIAIAKGALQVTAPPPRAPEPVRQPPIKQEDRQVNEREASELRETNGRLSAQVTDLSEQVRTLTERLSQREAGPPAGTRAHSRGHASELAKDDIVVDRGTVVKDRDADLPDHKLQSLDAIYNYVRERALGERPLLLKVLTTEHKIDVSIEYVTINVDGSTMKGRVARLINAGFFDNGGTQGTTRSELRRTGPDVNTGNLSKLFSELVRDGFLTVMGNNYTTAPGARSRITETK